MLGRADGRGLRLVSGRASKRARPAPLGSLAGRPAKIDRLRASER